VRGPCRALRGLRHAAVVLLTVWLLEHGGELGAFFLKRVVQGREPLFVLESRVGAAGKERYGGFRQGLVHVAVALRAGGEDHQRCHPIGIRHVHGRTVEGQQFDRFRSEVPGRGVQRRSASCVGRVDVCARLDQRAEDLRIAKVRRCGPLEPES